MVLFVSSTINWEGISFPKRGVYRENHRTTADALHGTKIFYELYRRDFRLPIRIQVVKESRKKQKSQLQEIDV